MILAAAAVLLKLMLFSPFSFMFPPVFF